MTNLSIGPSGRIVFPRAQNLSTIVVSCIPLFPAILICAVLAVIAGELAIPVIGMFFFVTFLAVPRAAIWTVAIGRLVVPSVVQRNFKLWGVVHHDGMKIKFDQLT